MQDKETIAQAMRIVREIEDFKTDSALALNVRDLLSIHIGYTSWPVADTAEGRLGRSQTLPLIQRFVATRTVSLLGLAAKSLP